MQTLSAGQGSWEYQYLWLVDSSEYVQRYNDAHPTRVDLCFHLLHIAVCIWNNHGLCGLRIQGEWIAGFPIAFRSLALWAMAVVMSSLCCLHWAKSTFLILNSQQYVLQIQGWVHGTCIAYCQPSETLLIVVAGSLLWASLRLLDV